MALCSSNLTSGFIDLATYDEQEKYLYGGPDSVAYFVREIRKATWFTQVPVCLSKSSGTPGFGQQWSVSISRAGDYLLQSWLRLQLTAVTASTGNATVAGTTGNHVIRWTRNLMHNLIQECNITFNDLVAARFDNYHLDFWNAFTVPDSKRAGYNTMIGNVDALVNPAALGLPGATAGAAQVIPAMILNLPLPFFYTRDTGLALPTAALPYNEMKINFSFQTWQNLLITDTWNNSSGTWASVPTVTTDLAGGLEPTMSNVQVWANYAIVSNEERKKMACAPRDILIEQVQTAPVQNFLPGTNTSPVYDIRFSHAIKALFFGCRNYTNLSAGSNYTTGQQLPLGSNTGLPGSVASTNALFGVVDFNSGTDPIANTTLIYESTQRLYQMGSDYFSLINPYYSAPRIPVETGYHVYSYSLDFFNIDPLGSTNYGKLTNVSIAPVASADSITSVSGYTAKYNFICTALNNNVIRISGGKPIGCHQQQAAVRDVMSLSRENSVRHTFSTYRNRISC